MSGRIEPVLIDHQSPSGPQGLAIQENTPRPIRRPQWPRVLWLIIIIGPILWFSFQFEHTPPVSPMPVSCAPLTFGYVECDAITDEIEVNTPLFHSLANPMLAALWAAFTFVTWQSRSIWTMIAIFGPLTFGISITGALWFWFQIDCVKILGQTISCSDNKPDFPDIITGGFLLSQFLLFALLWGVIGYGLWLTSWSLSAIFGRDRSRQTDT